MVSAMPLLRTDPTALPTPALIDVHVHLSADGGPGLSAGDWPALASASGIRTTAVFPPLRTGGYAQANEALRAASIPHAGAWKPFARLGGPVPFPAVNGRPSFWQLRRAMRSRVGRRTDDVQGGPSGLTHYSGVKLLPHMDGFPGDEWLEAIDAFELPVLVHSGEHVPPASLEKGLIRRLRSPVVLGHLGSFPASAPHLLQAIELAERYPHVFLETSGCWLAEFVALASRRVPEQLLFGSDAPLMHPAVAWNLVATAVNSDEQCERIAHRTAEQVLGW